MVTRAVKWVHFAANDKALRTSLNPLELHCTNVRFTEKWQQAAIAGPRVPSGAIPPALKEKVKMELSARLVNSVRNFEDLPDVDGRVENDEQPNQRRVTSRRTSRIVKVTPAEA